METDITTNAPLSVFITGATSAIGRAVMRQLRAAGHRVTGATTDSEGAILVRADGGIPSYPDLMRAGELRSVMAATKTDVVINLAPQIANYLPQQPAEWDATLYDEGVAALEAAAQAAGVQFVVHTSFAFADAHGEHLHDLLHAIRAGEQTALNGAAPGCVLRMGYLYGAESPELIHVRDLLMMGRMIDCGPDDVPANWVYVPDAARAVVAAAEQRPAGALLNIVDDLPTSPAAFLRFFAETQGISAPQRAPRFAVWAQPSKQQAALMRLSAHASNADAKEKLGWQPRFPNYQQGIGDALLSWRAVESER